MSDLLQQAATWLDGMRQAHLSRPVTYRRGETELELQATFGRTEYEVEDGYGLRVAAQVTDFLVSAADLLPTFGEPEAGDEIVTTGAVFEVMPLAGQGHWRWTDPHRTAMRIHSRQIDEE